MKTKLEFERICEEYSNVPVCSACLRPIHQPDKQCSSLDTTLFRDLDSHSQLKTASKIAQEGQ